MDAPQASERPKVGLVLSGGGARGAYEVGVLRYICERLPKPGHFDIIVGSSVGAINGAYMAATADRPRGAGRMLSRVWSDLKVDEVYRFGWAQMRNLPQVLFGKNLPKITHGASVGGVVDPGHLEDLVRTRIPWRGITDNLYHGRLEAFACSATELATGVTTVFVQTSSGSLPRHWPAEHGQSVVITPITAAHCLASGAIPVLFPAVRIGDQMFVDGSLRQNTPIRPAMRLGATRLLVVSLRHGEFPETATRAREEARSLFPNAMFMLGKMLNALMLDKLEADLSRIKRTNELLDAGIRIWGPEFPLKLAEAMTGRTHPYMPVDVVQIRPSEDLGRIAFDVISRTRLGHYSGMMARWLRRVVLTPQDMPESDLASYVLFDPEYIRRLIDLGYQDAAKQHHRLVSLFDV